MTKRKSRKKKAAPAPRKTPKKNAPPKRKSQAGRSRVESKPSRKRKHWGRSPERIPGIANTLLYDFRGLNKEEVNAQLGRVRNTLARWMRTYKVCSVAIEWRGIKYETDEGEEGPRQNWWEPFTICRTVDDPLFTGAPGWVGVREVLGGFGGKLRKVYLGVFVR